MNATTAGCLQKTYGIARHSPYRRVSAKIIYSTRNSQRINGQTDDTGNEGNEGDTGSEKLHFFEGEGAWL
jgi:hypothetical protein